MDSTKANAVVGIDAGTSTFEISIISKTGLANSVVFDDGTTMLRSVIFFQDDGTATVGQEAENLLLLNPTQGVRHWKRHMGTDDVLFTSKSGQNYRTDDLAVEYLRHCKNSVETETGMDYRDAVITVPANYTDSQKQSTIRAAKTAGFSYQIATAELVDARSGRAVALAQHQLHRGQLLLRLPSREVGPSRRAHYGQPRTQVWRVTVFYLGCGGRLRGCGLRADSLCGRCDAWGPSDHC